MEKLSNGRYQRTWDGLLHKVGGPALANARINESEEDGVFAGLCPAHPARTKGF